MSDRRIRMGTWIALMVACRASLYAGNAPAPPDKAGAQVFRNEPQARALYDRMIEAFRRPQTLSYQSKYRQESQGQEFGRCPYRVWLKKPNYFRVEVGPVAYPDGPHGGTIVGDGQNLWLFWRGDRPYTGGDLATYANTRSKVYLKQATPLARHSIAHMTLFFHAGMVMPILDPSTFHGYTDSLQRYIDGVMRLGVERVGDELCDVVEVSIMKRQRSWCLWLSQNDHLPRRLKQVLRLSQDIVIDETWSDIIIDGEIPAAKFVWTPPEGWQEWEPPQPEDTLLKPGTPAPDFELTALDGGRIKLADFRDKIVWLYIWRAG